MVGSAVETIVWSSEAMSSTRSSAPKMRFRDFISTDPFERGAAEDLLLGDGALGAAAAEKRDRPVCEHEDAVLEPRQPDEMDDEPQQPGRESGDPEAADAADGAEAGDRRERPTVAVDEGTRARVAVETPLDRPGGMAARLDRGLRDTGNAVEAHQVADHEHLRVSGQREVAARPSPGRRGRPRRRPPRPGRARAGTLRRRPPRSSSRPRSAGAAGPRRLSRFPRHRPP